MKKILSYKMVQLALLTLTAVVLSVFLSIVKTKEYSTWVSADAVVTGWKTARRVSHILYFRYTVDGVEYNGYDSFKGNFPKEKTGDIVTVWYDPDDATRVMRSDTKPDAGLWTYAPFILALPISLYIASGGNKRRSRALR